MSCWYLWKERETVRQATPTSGITFVCSAAILTSSSFEQTRDQNVDDWIPNTPSANSLELLINAKMGALLSFKQISSMFQGNWMKLLYTGLGPLIPSKQRVSGNRASEWSPLIKQLFWCDVLRFSVMICTFANTWLKITHKFLYIKTLTTSD